MHDLNINIYACSYGTGSSFIWHAVQVTDSMKGIVDNTALLCLTGIARAHWPCVYGTTVDLRDRLGHLSWHSFIILMDRTGDEYTIQAECSIFTFLLHLHRFQYMHLENLFLLLPHVFLLDWIWKQTLVFRSSCFLNTHSNFSVPLNRTLDLHYVILFSSLTWLVTANVRVNLIYNMYV